MPRSRLAWVAVAPTPRPARPARPADRSPPITASPSRTGIDAETAVAAARRVIFESSSTGMAVVAPDGTVVDVNPALLAIFGADRSELVGRHLVDLALPEHREMTQAWLDRVRAGDLTPLHNETLVGDRPGRSRWFVTDGHAALDGHGRVEGLIVSVEEATAARRLHGQLASAYQDLAVLLDILPVAVCRVRQGAVVMWNPAAEALFGWTTGEVNGRPVVDLFDGPDDVFRVIQERVAAGEHLQGEHLPATTKSGDALEVRTWTTDVEGPDGESELLVLVVDVTEDAAMRRAVAASEHRWRTLVKNVSDVVTVVDAEGYIRATAGEVRPILGYPSDAWVDTRIHDLIHPDDKARIETVIEDVLSRPGETINAEVRLQHHDGGWADVWVSAVNLLDDPTVEGVVLTTRNITQRKQAEALVASQSRILELIARGEAFDDVVEAIASMVEDHDPGAQATVLLIDGPRFRPRSARGRGPSPLIRSRLAEMEVEAVLPTLLAADVPEVVLDVSADDRILPSMAEAMVESGITSLWWASVLSRDTHVPQAVLIGFHEERHEPSEHACRAIEMACSLISIALERHATVNELAHRSLHDDLTGLPNRTLLLDRLQIGLDRAQRMGDELGVLYVDLDRFKMVNDSLGLAAGDMVLTEVAERLRAVTRPDDTIARVAADEFVIVCDRPGSLPTILSVADRLTEAMKEPFTVDDGEVFLTASLGLALSTPGTDGPALLRKADAAMFRAKQRGRDRLEMYDAAMQASAHDRLALGSHLRRAVDRDELYLAYQPIVDLATGEIVGAEALCRWHHPRRGEVPPAAFIPVAEETGTIVEIGNWVLETALAELRAVSGRTTRSGERPFSLSVNLSPRQLDDPGLSNRVGRVLHAHGWSPDRLCLELTETAITKDLDAALRVLVKLRATGVRVAVDDFGTGYSSLTHLHRLPIDTIKIDRSFITVLGEAGSADRSTVAAAVLGIAHAMGLEAIAEGVETSAQLQVLRELGCHQGQGYLFSLPVPAETLIASLDLAAGGDG